MNLPTRLQERLERVLELGERYLGELVDDGGEARLFETHRAFRWDAGRGRGYRCRAADGRAATVDRSRRVPVH